MPDYSRSIIYKLCCNNTDITDIYIGSTTLFSDRKRKHKSDCNNPNYTYYHLKVYEFIRSNGGFDNWSIIEIEAYNAADKKDLETRERYHIELLKPTLNNNVPTRTRKEYYENNRSRLLAEQKISKYNNKEKIKQRENRKVDCDCGSKYTHAHRSRHLKTKKHQFYQNLLDFIYF
jgi:hypothetical protein